MPEHPQPEHTDHTAADDAETVRRMAALGGLHLTPARAAALAPALADLRVVDAAVAALRLGTLPAVGHPWEAWSDEAHRRG
jgi:hypothetical protein